MQNVVPDGRGRRELVSIGASRQVRRGRALRGVRSRSGRRRLLVKLNRFTARHDRSGHSDVQWHIHRTGAQIAPKILSRRLRIREAGEYVCIFLLMARSAACSCLVVCRLYGWAARAVWAHRFKRLRQRLLRQRLLRQPPLRQPPLRQQRHLRLRRPAQAMPRWIR